MDSGFEARIYALVEKIPQGCVASYGQLALMAGYPHSARRAGRALSRAPKHLPCHRVVRSSGKTVPGWPEQPVVLRSEGVVCRPGGTVDMRRCRWQPFR